MRTGSRSMMGARGWSVVLAVLVVAGLAAPTALIADDDEAYSGEYAETEGPLRECLETASKEYNACLYEAGTRWSRTMCDLIYESEVALCWAEQLGKIRRAIGVEEELN